MAEKQAGSSVKNARQTPDIIQQKPQFTDALGVIDPRFEGAALIIHAIWHAERGTAAEVTL